MRKHKIKLALLALLTAVAMAGGWAEYASAGIGAALAGSCGDQCVARESSLAGSAGARSSAGRESAFASSEPAMAGSKGDKGLGGRESSLASDEPLMAGSAGASSKVVRESS